MREAKEKIRRLSCAHPARGARAPPPRAPFSLINTAPRRWRSGAVLTPSTTRQKTDTRYAGRGRASMSGRASPGPARRAARSRARRGCSRRGAARSAAGAPRSAPRAGRPRASAARPAPRRGPSPPPRAPGRSRRSPIYEGVRSNASTRAMASSYFRPASDVFVSVARRRPCARRPSSGSRRSAPRMTAPLSAVSTR